MPQQVRLNFERMTEAGMKTVVARFEKQGLKVAAIKATNRPKRESGYLTKSVTFTFDTGQNLEVRVKSDGTVFQVKLNRKVVPIKHVDNMNKAILELVDAVQDNEKKYLKAKKRREAKVGKQIGKTLKTGAAARTTRREQLDVAKSMHAELQTEFYAQQEQLTTLADFSAIEAQISEKDAELAILKDKNSTLKSELKSLQEVK